MGLFFVLFSILFAQQAEQISGVEVTKIEKPQKELRFAVSIPAALDDVWNAFSTTEGLKTWLWSDVRVELRPGGDGIDPPGDPLRVRVHQ